MTDERRRITWGNQDATHDPEVKNYNLDPFVIDREGHVFNSGKESQKPVVQLGRSDAFKAWRTASYGGTGRRLPRPDLGFESEEDMVKEVHTGHVVFVQKPNGGFIGPPEEILEPVWELCSGCRFQDRTPAPLSTKEINRLYRDRSIPMKKRCGLTTRRINPGPEEWIPFSGDRYNGWVSLFVPNRFSTIFHGPSMAAVVFK